MDEWLNIPVWNNDRRSTHEDKIDMSRKCRVSAEAGGLGDYVRPRRAGGRLMGQSHKFIISSCPQEKNVEVVGDTSKQDVKLRQTNKNEIDV
jgi:hypothetical protein